MLDMTKAVAWRGPNPKYDALPIAGRLYAIIVYGTQLALTCVNETELRLRRYDGRDTQRFRCTNDDGYTGFFCNGTGHYLGFNTWGTIVCQVSRQQSWEHIHIVPDSQGGHMLWMNKDSQFAPVSQASGLELRLMAKSATRFSFRDVDQVPDTKVGVFTSYDRKVADRSTELLFPSQMSHGGQALGLGLPEHGRQDGVVTSGGL
ncbi:hypothetical protein B0I37DRAFT_386589 [Chaetomium sp. MPI-CAGE-AT-0009]|nr:hypothetical protein B0I37DRAFT_386589 [Chaetomium sp. MPI-CAGE-AT-0009]